MLRVTKIVEKSCYILVCKFNNGIVKQLDILPIIENHRHLNGVQNLLDESVFFSVRIGEFGEIVWDKLVKTNTDGVEVDWDYDISPEYAYQNSIAV